MATSQPTKTFTSGIGMTHYSDVNDRIRIVDAGPPIIALPPVKIGRIGSAMLFVPLAAALVEQAPMLIYYHGHHGPETIEGYVTSQTERDFRPLLSSTKVLLVEPQGGPKSKFEDLSTPAGLASLIDWAMFNAFTLGPKARPAPMPTPLPRSLILAGFSGGGAALNNVVLDVTADYINRLTEVWCFDCMYSGEGEEWVRWARKTKKTLRVRVSTEEDSGKPRAEADVIRAYARSLRNIDIDKTVKATHEGLPGMFIPGWL